MAVVGHPPHQMFGTGENTVRQHRLVLQLLFDTQSQVPVMGIARPCIEQDRYFQLLTDRDTVCENRLIAEANRLIEFEPAVLPPLFGQFEEPFLSGLAVCPQETFQVDNVARTAVIGPREVQEMTLQDGRYLRIPRLLIIGLYRTEKHGLRPELQPLPSCDVTGDIDGLRLATALAEAVAAILRQVG